MNSRARFIIAAMLFAGLFVTFISAGELHAASDYTSRTEWGGADAAVSDSNPDFGYNRTKSGATWYYYSMSNKSYDDDFNLYVPFNNDYPGPKVAIPAKTCQGYGGFWVLLRNEYNIKTGALTDKPATAIKLSDIKQSDLGSFKNSFSSTNIIAYKNRNSGIPNDIQDGVKAAKYGTMADIYALYQKLKYTSAVPESAKNNPENLSYFCSSPNGTVPSTMAPIHTFTTVSIENGATNAPVVDGNSYLGGYQSQSGIYPDGIAIPTTESLPKVTFHFYVAREYSDYDLTVGTITTTRGNISSQELNNRDRTWYINGTRYLYAEVKAEEVSSFPGNSAMRDITVTGGSYNIANFEFSPATSGGSKSSSARITFVRISANSNFDKTIVTSCDQRGDGQYRNSSTIGNTVATVGVSKNQDSVVTTTAAPRDDTAKVYAKPGDSVRFSYALCFGVTTPTFKQKNRKGEQVDAPVVGLNWHSRAIYTTFRVFGNQDEMEEGARSILFAPWNETLLGGRVTISNQAVRKGKFGFYLGGDLSSQDGERYEISDTTFWDERKKQISFASPDPRDKAGVASSSDKEEDADIDSTDGFDEYDCAYYTGATKDTLTGYYIPGFNKLDDKVDCASAELRGSEQTSAVGASINQTLQYTFTAAWWKPNSGYCGINDRRVINSNLDDAISAYNDAINGNNNRCTVAGGASARGTFDIYKTGSIVVPYNFNINLTGKVTNHDSEIVYAGDILEYAGHVDVLPRANPLTSDKDSNGNPVPYATTMPGNSSLKLVEFLIPDSAKREDVEYKLKQGYLPEGDLNKPSGERAYSTATDNETCKYYENILGDDIEDCKARTLKGYGAINEEDSIVGNNNSDPKGEMNYYDKTENLVVPDVKAGYKYCAAFVISYGDSHGVPFAILQGDNKNAANYAANDASVNTDFDTTPSSYRWYGTNVTCKTVAKKPSFQTWNSGVYSDNNITSSISKKSVNARLGNFEPGTELPQGKGYTEKDIAPDQVYFGSWAEYYVVARGAVTGFASASALSYNTNFGGLSTGGYGSADTLDYCDLSRLTIANISCQDNPATAGYLNGKNATNTTVTNGKNLRQKIINYYTPPDDQISEYTNSFIRSSNEIGNNFDNLPEWRGAKTLITNSNFTIDQTHVQYSGTLVIKVNGHLDIKGNICLGEGTCGVTDLTDYSNYYSRDTNNLSLNSRNNTVFDADSLASIPQVILIAKSISIDSEVSQIDAWLITYSDDDFNNDSVNTCAGFQDGKTETSSCWKTLKINGPIITTALLLNRTGGAWPGYSGDVGNQAYETLIGQKKEWVAYCTNRNKSQKDITNCVNNLINQASGGDDNIRKAYEAADRYAAQMDIYQAGGSYWRDLTCGGSITPAEILDLHPLVYIWAYVQSLRLGQATINFAQELAPRY